MWIEITSLEPSMDNGTDTFWIGPVADGNHIRLFLPAT
jgi:hypothetical protein